MTQEKPGTQDPIAKIEEFISEMNRERDALTAKIEAEFERRRAEALAQTRGKKTSVVARHKYCCRALMSCEKQQSQGHQLRNRKKPWKPQACTCRTTAYESSFKSIWPLNTESFSRTPGLPECRWIREKRPYQNGSKPKSMRF